MSVLSKLFGNKAPVQSQAAVEEEIARSLVRRFAEGNVSLQMGEYMTGAEFDQLRSEVLSHDFKQEHKK